MPPNPLFTTQLALLFLSHRDAHSLTIATAREKYNTSIPKDFKLYQDKRLQTLPLRDYSGCKMITDLLKQLQNPATHLLKRAFIACIPPAWPRAKDSWPPSLAG
eukprot:scaffold294247_cov15-Tisochrysis_lutea.AAC.1